MNNENQNDDSDKHNRRRWITLTPILVIALALGVVAGAAVQYGTEWFFGSPQSSVTAGAATVDDDTVWTCSMHPQVKLPEPGLCPICHMALEPLEQQSPDDTTGPPTFETSKQAAALMDLQTTEVRRQFVEARIRMVGKVDYDETRLEYITAWVGGRIDRLFVDYTGIPVKKGDHMVSLYSPELLSAQQELVQARRSLETMADSDLDIVRESTRATLEAAREKLRLLGLEPKQVQAIETTGKVTDHLTIYAPQDGIVIEKNAKAGMYVNTGTRIYTVADLSKVWVNLDAYESDLVWLRYGQHVSFTTVSYPGETFKGTISFIDPVLNQKTRTVKVRVIADNQHGKLKPGMFVRAMVNSRIAAGGRVMDPELAGKWISPMHPEVVKDQPGQCDVCGMPLVRAESLGYVAADASKADAPLVVPRSAVLLTGRRAVVYVEVPGTERPTYEGREIIVGPRAGEYYLVESGLAEGERVVTHGNFKIDSALQIRAQPSMLDPSGRVPYYPPKEAGLEPSFRKGYEQFIDTVLALGKALGDDDPAAATKAADQLGTALAGVDASGLSPPRKDKWTRHAASLKSIADKLDNARGLEPLRRQFALLSDEVLAVVDLLGPPTGEPLYRVHCPMAFDNRGADWLQDSREVHNPYFGATMLKCGSVTETFTAPRSTERPNPGKSSGGHEHDH